MRFLSNIARDLCIVLLGAVLLAPISHAEPYFTVGLGQGYLKHNGENMWWIQEGWDYRMKERSNIYRVGFGGRVNRWLAVEVNYHDLGRYEQFSGFVLPEEQYNAETRSCVSTCPPTHWGYLTGDVYGISATALPTWQVSKNWSVFARVGFLYYKAKFTAYVTRADQNDRRWEVNDWFTQKGLAPVTGVGITYDRVTLEWTQFAKIHADRNCCSPYRDASTTTLSYRWEF